MKSRFLHSDLLNYMEGMQKHYPNLSLHFFIGLDHHEVYGKIICIEIHASIEFRRTLSLFIVNETTATGICVTFLWGNTEYLKMCVRIYRSILGDT